MLKIHMASNTQENNSNTSTNIESDLTDNTYGRFPTSHTKTWWREIVNLPKSNRKPKQMCRIIKGYQTQAMRIESPEEHDDSPVRAVRPKLAKLIGAKSCKQVIKWHHAVKLDKQKWPHGYKGRKSHSIDFLLEENNNFDEYDDFFDEFDSFFEEQTTDIEQVSNDIPIFINTTDQFPLLIPSESTNQNEMRKTVWLNARNRALEPLRIATRKAEDANLVANEAKTAFFKAAEEARIADAKYMSRYQNLFRCKPKSQSYSLEAAKTKATNARNKADQLSSIMIEAIKVAESLQIIANKMKVQSNA